MLRKPVRVQVSVIFSSMPCEQTSHSSGKYQNSSQQFVIGTFEKVFKRQYGTAFFERAAVGIWQGSVGPVSRALEARAR